MKNVKYLGLVGLGCSLLLTGCGSGSSNSNTDNSNKDNSSDKGNTGSSINEKVPVKHIFTCIKAEDGAMEKIEFEFNDKENKTVGAKWYVSVKIPNDATGDEIKKTMSNLKDYRCNYEIFEKCDVSNEGNKIELNAIAGPSAFEEDDGRFYYESKEDVMIDFEGFTCE